MADTVARPQKRKREESRSNKYGTRGVKIGAELVRQQQLKNIELCFAHSQGILPPRGIPSPIGNISCLSWKDSSQMPPVIDALNLCIDAKAARGVLSENLTQALRDLAVVPRLVEDRKTYSWLDSLVWEFSEEAWSKVQERREKQRVAKLKKNRSDQPQLDAPQTSNLSGIAAQTKAQGEVFPSASASSAWDYRGIEPEHPDQLFLATTAAVPPELPCSLGVTCYGLEEVPSFSSFLSR
mmetsp:Transcript_5822/g.11770  ORF Transcript_5822/g.11770 Transcript_5822/m.11770 type:complete len:239 (-) Transcript_5822:76-792(-)